MLKWMRRKTDTSARNTPDGGQDRRLTHRSIHRLSLSLPKLSAMLFLPLIFNAATWEMFDLIRAFWMLFFEFWIRKLEIAGTVTLKAIGPTWLNVTLPYMELPSIAPSPLTWWSTLFITIIALLLSCYTPDRLLPMRYFIRVVGFIQITALIYFAAIPANFPYTLSTYIESALTTGIGFMLIIPWVHMLIYYVLDFSFVQKAGLTLMTLAFIIIALPFQVMAYASLLTSFSLLFLPLLTLMLGVPILIFMCIALYGWAMSWEHN